jgi:predicted nucleic acid-binding protein
MGYWDTSTLVKLYATEPDPRVFENHALNSRSQPLTSRITLYEAQATFRRKEAEGALRASAAQPVHRQLRQDVSMGEVRLVELDAHVEQEYERVLNLCYQQTPPILLRTLDAIHLASARAAGDTELVATDKRMRDAAKLLGFTLFPV